MSVADLKKTIDEQQAVIVNYESKLKDVVRAYKSIESEKKALEVALFALSDNTTAADESKTEGGISSSVQKDVESSGNSNMECGQLDSLKKALSTLTIENKKRELAFQADRKALLAKNEKLNNEISRLKSAADNLNTVSLLKQQLAEAEAQREKMLSDHGKIAAEMQQSYAKERVYSEQLGKQVAELSRRLQEKDDQLHAQEQRIREVNRMEHEIQLLRKRADATPTAKVLKEELLNCKIHYEKELSTTRDRYTVNLRTLAEKDSRIDTLENRISTLMEERANVEQEKNVLLSRIDELEKRLETAKNMRPMELIQTQATPEKSSVHKEIQEDLNESALEEKLRADCCRFKEMNLTAYTKLIEMLALEIADYTMTAGKSCGEAKTDSNNCETCNIVRREKDDFKSQIYELQRKLNHMEELHKMSKESHEQTAEVLRQKIINLEASLDLKYSSVITECKQKVQELEEELSKQQARMRDIIDEKDQEIEYTRNTLMSMYTKNNSDPLDPAPMKTGNAGEGNDSPLGVDRECNLNLHGRLPSKHSQRTFKSSDDAYNIFYEQEITKRENEIFELRNMIRLSELKVRDIEQAMLTKDIQYLQIVETLKEEIRVLEGKLSLERSETNMAYLRNIFVQLINASNAKSRRHILKAIGAVLRLTAAEMKKIESWNI